MDASFEAVLEYDIEISNDEGSVRLRPGTYMVMLNHNESGMPNGARLQRIDRPSAPSHITPRHYNMLKGVLKRGAETASIKKRSSFRARTKRS